MTKQVNTSQEDLRQFDPRLFLRDAELDRGVGLILAAERALSIAGDVARRTAGLSEGEAALAMLLRAQPGLELPAARAALRATTPTFARLLARMEARGLIEKAPGTSDARRRRLRLSDAGEALTEPLTKAMRDALRRAYREAGAAQVSGARALLEALTDE